MKRNHLASLILSLAAFACSTDDKKKPVPPQPEKKDSTEKATSPEVQEESKAETTSVTPAPSVPATTTVASSAPSAPTSPVLPTVDPVTPSVIDPTLSSSMKLSPAEHLALDTAEAKHLTGLKDIIREPGVDDENYAAVIAKLLEAKEYAPIFPKKHVKQLIVSTHTLPINHWGILQIDGNSPLEIAYLLISLNQGETSLAKLNAKIAAVKTELDEKIEVLCSISLSIEQCEKGLDSLLSMSKEAIRKKMLLTHSVKRIVVGAQFSVDLKNPEDFDIKADASIDEIELQLHKRPSSDDQGAQADL